LEEHVASIFRVPEERNASNFIVEVIYQHFAGNAATIFRVEE
jgi:hypothetical protein